MLPQFMRVIAVNNTGQTVAYATGGRLNLKITGWNINPTTGEPEYTQLSDSDLNFTTGNIVDGAEESGEPAFISTGEISNISNTFLGLQIQFEVTHDNGTAVVGGATYDLYLDSGDATGELQSDASGYTSAENGKLDFIGSLIWAGGLDGQLTRSNTFNLE